MSANRLDRCLGQHIVKTLIQGAGSGRYDNPINLKTSRIQHPAGARGNFRTNPVAGEENDGMVSHDGQYREMKANANEEACVKLQTHLVSRSLSTLK